VNERLFAAHTAKPPAHDPKPAALPCRPERCFATPRDDYVIEDHADHVLATFKTQHEAIDWAKQNGHSPHVARVRHLNDKKKPITGARRRPGAGKAEVRKR
jgi:hypothetical protein